MFGRKAFDCDLVVKGYDAQGKLVETVSEEGCLDYWLEDILRDMQGLDGSIVRVVVDFRRKPE